MPKYRPVPRTLSEAVLKVVTGPLDPSQLVSPEQLASHMPLMDPETLFREISPRPSSRKREKENRRATSFESPKQLFGGQAIAPPGQALIDPECVKPGGTKPLKIPRKKHR